MTGISEFIDTLSYGTWKTNQKMMILDSDKKLSQHIFEINVEESLSGSKDTIYFYIENNLDGLYDAEDNYTPYIYFSVNAEYANGQITESKCFDKTICVGKRASSLKNLNVKIIPNLIIYPEKISGKAFDSFNYKIESVKNNTFKIKIIDFDTRCFAYRQFNGEYIEIINDDTLLWDNEFYIKEKVASGVNGSN